MTRETVVMFLVSMLRTIFGVIVYVIFAILVLWALSGCGDGTYRPDQEFDRFLERPLACAACINNSAEVCETSEVCRENE